MSVKIWFTPQDGASSAVGTEFSGADYIQKDLQNLANKFNPETADGGVKVEDLNKEVLTEIDARVEAKVGVERAARIADDTETLQSAKSYTDTSITKEASARTTADTETLQSAKSYTDTSIATETSARTTADTNTLQSAKSYTDTSIANEASARTTADTNTLQSAKSYTDTSIANEASARRTADTETLQSAKSYTDTTVNNLATKDSVASAIADDHTHSNKTVIDGITQSDIDKWNAGGGGGSGTDERIISLTENPTDEQYRDYDHIVAVYAANTSVTYIAQYAFSGCVSLAELSLPYVTGIDNDAFSGCASLTEVYLPNTEALGAYAFSGCSNLSEVHLSGDIDQILAYTFFNCPKLQLIDMSTAKQIPIIDNKSIPKNNGLRIVVPKSLINEWKVADGWSEYADYIFTSPYPR